MLEGKLSGQYDVENDTKCPYICLEAIVGLFFHNLRRHVGRRAQANLQEGSLRLLDTKPEVNQSRLLSFFGDDDVL